MLRRVFSGCGQLMSPGAVVWVRTDARAFTLEATIEAVERAFPKKTVRIRRFSRPGFTQTALFDPGIQAKGEVDLAAW